MEENKVLRRCNDDEIEIDLVELWHELIGNAGLIGGITAAFVAAAAAYSFMVLKPVYGYSALLRVPNYNVTLQNTCVEMLKGDIGQCGLSGVGLTKGSAVIRLSFSGTNPEKLTTDAKAYLPKAVEKVQRIVDEGDMTRIANERLNIMQTDINDIRLRMSNERSGVEIVNRLDTLLKRLDEKEANKASLKVELSAPEKASNVPIAPNKKKNIGLAFVAGLFLSCGWVIARYVFRKSREGK